MYRGENNLTQLGVDVGEFQGERSGTEAFDEPLTRQEVPAIAAAFIV